MNNSRKLVVAGILLVGLATLACPKRTNIAEIQRNPGKYQDKEVAIAGRVVDSYGVSIPGIGVGGGAYKVDDGTGSIWIVATESGVPARGAEVGVKGRVNSGVNWRGRDYGLAIMESDRRYSKK